MRKVLITGGSRGIGAGCVRAFAKSGDSVAFIYKSNDIAAEAVSCECGAKAIKADLSIPAEAERAVAEALDYLGGVDVLISCAGIAQIKLFTDITDSDFAKMINSNLTSAFTVAREVAKNMIKQHSGRIVFIGSMWGKTGASCEVHYSASKAAIRGMTMALAKELGPSGITVNCIEPGLINTDMNAGLGESAKAELVDETPMCRIGTPEDIANAAMFFASEKSGFVTGQILGVDGGFAV